MNEHYESQKRRELLWYGWSEEEAERESRRTDYVVLERDEMLVVLQLDTDLFYYVSLDGLRYGLQEMRLLFRYLSCYAGHLRSLQHYKEAMLVPPAIPFSDDGDDLYLLYYEHDRYTCVLGGKEFELDAILRVYDFLCTHNVTLEQLLLRNQLSEKEKYG